MVLADKASGKVAWSDGLTAACRARYTACDQNKMTDVAGLARSVAASGSSVETSCGPVSWSAGPAGKSNLVYAAVMSGNRALPGREITLRLKDVFANSGL